MRIRYSVSALIIFELTLMLVSSVIYENQNAIDLPEYKNKSDRKNVICVEFDEEYSSDGEILPKTAINMSPDYTINSCSDPFEKADELFNAQRYDDAIRYLNETINICPDYAEAWYDRGYARFQTKSYSEALDDFIIAIELNPTDSDYWAFKGIVLLKLKKYEEAINAFNTSLNINPNCSYALRWKAHVLNMMD
jgi:tetratricopeptide (TPR) repeat protein